MFGYEILFVHGAWAGPWAFAPWSAYLAAEGWSVRSLTLPGHSPGDSDFRFDLTDYVDYLAGSVDKPEKTILVGHSTGGWVCLKYLESHRAAASVLVAPLPWDGLPGRARNALLRLGAWGCIRTLVFGRPGVLKDDAIVRATCFSPSTPAPVVRRYRERLVPESAPAARQIAWMRLTGPSVNRQKLGRNQAGTPHLILASPEDFYFRPGELAETAKALGARLEELPGYPHAMMELDEDRTLAARVERWLLENLDLRKPEDAPPGGTGGDP